MTLFFKGKQPYCYCQVTEYTRMLTAIIHQNFANLSYMAVFPLTSVMTGLCPV